ncbi:MULTISPECIES: hypothetical protein [unclassified Mesorhizobium]|uniref:hypothetical protein n=1 Tax=unclassified Mesorhizobium TaxID=325217 RepID=UPI0016728873|nr:MULTISPECIES: hypothetical protein [unclassified Mesorhizobium]
MIDQRLVAISSVNLNNRSFFHDSENGLLVWRGNGGTARRLLSLAMVGGVL